MPEENFTDNQMTNPKEPSDESRKIATEVIATRFRLDTPTPAALRLIGLFARALDERFRAGRHCGVQEQFERPGTFDEEETE
jgi:hypothetical protein